MGVGTRVTGGLSTSMSKLRRTQQRKSDERFAERFALQWAAIRAERRPEEPVGIQAGESNYTRAQVPHGVDLAAAWSWRFLVLVAAGYVVAQGISMFAVVVLPLVDRAAADRAGRAGRARVRPAAHPAQDWRPSWSCSAASR